jgi:hypothetical protein
VDALSKKTFPVINPSNGKKIVEVAAGDKVNFFTQIFMIMSFD